jgi:hypothetical protein
MNDETPKIVTEVLNFIKSKGHTCCYIHHVTKQIEWCHSDVCEGPQYHEKNKQLKIEQMNRVVEFADLKRNGHSCMKVLNTYPIKVEWCERSPCKCEDEIRGKINKEQEEREKQKGQEELKRILKL